MVANNRCGSGMAVQGASERDDWPVVAIDDPGLRQSTGPNECFYCGRKTGERHGAECVIVEKRVLYDVLIDGVVVGTFLDGARLRVSQERFLMVRRQWCGCD